MSDDHVQLPIKIDATSNGEFLPVPIGRTVAQAKALAAARITDNARRLNLSRRTFLTCLRKGAILCHVSSTVSSWYVSLVCPR